MRSRDAQEAGVVELGDHSFDLLQLRLGNLEPLVECIDELATHVLAWHLKQVLVGLQQNLLAPFCVSEWPTVGAPEADPRRKEATTTTCWEWYESVGFPSIRPAQIKYNSE